MISYQGFTKRYGPVLAVADLKLEVRAGETLALIGPNGSGKTTTLKAALGLVRPTAGRVLVEGHDVATDGRAARARLGYLPQRLAYPEGCTGRELAHLYARVRGTSTTDADRLLERVALHDVADRDADGYSGGMRQRLGLAIALLGAPPTLVLDEPTAALDPTGALLVRDQLMALRDERTAVLLSSHDLAEVSALADRVGVFATGRLVALGTPAALARDLGLRVRLHVRFSVLVDAAPHAAERAGARGVRYDGEQLRCDVLPGGEARVLDALRSTGSVLAEITMREPGLEDVYRAITGADERLVA